MTASAKCSASPESRLLFKPFLRKIGSGERTSSGLSRDEAKQAIQMIVEGGASPAQIGAFLIAHRIRRPEPQELAGMIDYYRQVGPRLTSQRQAFSFGMPFDGRTRTAPLYPLTSLLLAACGYAVVLQGGERMPVKYGVTPQELFAGLGLSLSGLSIQQVQDGLDRFGLALMHQPDHFPIAQSLIPYREDLGKRPPVASLELLWSCLASPHLLVSGFVHPPTETRAWQTLRLAGERDVMTVKGLEGSTDLPTGRSNITAHVLDGDVMRHILHPREFGCDQADPAWQGEGQWSELALQALRGQGPLYKPLLWNVGVYLWIVEAKKNVSPISILPDYIERARQLIYSQTAIKLLSQVTAWRNSLAT